MLSGGFFLDEGIFFCLLVSIEVTRFLIFLDARYFSCHVETHRHQFKEF